MKNTAHPRCARCISILSRLRTYKGDSHLHLIHFQLFNVKTCWIIHHFRCYFSSLSYRCINFTYNWITRTCIMSENSTFLILFNCEYNPNVIFLFINLTVSFALNASYLFDLLTVQCCFQFYYFNTLRNSFQEIENWRQYIQEFLSVNVTSIFCKQLFDMNLYFTRATISCTNLF